MNRDVRAVNLPINKKDILTGVKTQVSTELQYRLKNL